MARTAEQIVQAELGALKISVCMLTAENEQLKEEIAGLRAHLAKQEPTETPA